MKMTIVALAAHPGRFVVAVRHDKLSDLRDSDQEEASMISHNPIALKDVAVPLHR